MSKAMELAVTSAVVNGAFATFEKVIKSAEAAAERGENQIVCQLASNLEIKRVTFLLRAQGFTVIRGTSWDPPETLTVTWGI